jgi:hypothetical protein
MLMAELSLYNIETYGVENAASNNSIVACLFVAADNCLACRCLAMAVLASSFRPSAVMSQYDVSCSLYFANVERRANEVINT